MTLQFDRCSDKMSLQKKLKNLEEKYKSKESSLKQFEDSEHLTSQLINIEKEKLENSKRKAVYSHLDEYLVQELYLRTDNKRYSIESRMERALLQFTKRDKNGVVKRKRDGSIDYQLKYRRKPELPDLFAEIGNSIKTENLLISNVSEVKEVCCWETVGMCGFTILFSAVGIPVGMIVGGLAGLTFGIPGLVIRNYKLKKPEEYLEIARKTDKFLKDEVKPYLIGCGPYRSNDLELVK